jgi:DNA-binding NarL/FixJ family response regulator
VGGGGRRGQGVRVLVVDPQELFRRGLMLLLEQQDEIEVVGEAEDGAEAVARAGELCPDVVLMEVRLPVVNGSDAARTIMSCGSGCPAKVLILTSSEDDDDLYEAVRAGAAGYLLKDASVPELAKAIRSVVEGHSPVSPSMASKLLSGLNSLARQADGAQRHPPLTARELEVLRLVARGLSNREVAAELFIAENTVKNHVRNILEKLRLHSRMQAVMHALREHLIEPEGA